MGRPIFSQRFLERHGLLGEQEQFIEPVASTSTAKQPFDPDAPLGDDHVYEAFIAQDDLAAAVLPSTPRTDAAIESHPISAAAPTSYPHEQHASRPETPSPMDEACDAEPPVTPSSGAFFTRTLALMAPPPPRTNRSPSPVHRPMVQLASPPPSRA